MFVAPGSSGGFTVSAELFEPLTCIAQGYTRTNFSQDGNYTNVTVTGPPSANITLRVNVIGATSLYVVPSYVTGTSPQRVASNGSHWGMPYLEPSIVEKLATSVEWGASQTDPSFAQTIDIYTPLSFVTFLNTNRFFLVDYPPYLLTYLTGFVLVPSYRRLSSPLSHYGCPSPLLMPSFATSNVAFADAAHVPASSTVDAAMPVDYQFYIFNLITTLASGFSNATQTFTQETKDVSPATYYFNVDAQGNVTLVPDDRTSTMRPFMITAPFFIGGMVFIAVCGFLFRFRMPLLQAIFLRHERQYNRLVVHAGVDEVVMYDTGIFYAARVVSFHIVRICVSQCTSIFLPTLPLRLFMKMFFQPRKKASMMKPISQAETSLQQVTGGSSAATIGNEVNEEEAILLDDLTEEFRAFARIRFLDFLTSSCVKQMVGYLATFGAEVRRENIQMAIGIKAVESSLGLASAGKRIFGGRYVMTHKNDDQVPVQQIMQAMHVTKDQVLSQLAFLSIKVGVAKTEAVYGIRRVAGRSYKADISRLETIFALRWGYFSVLPVHLGIDRLYLEPWRAGLFISQALLMLGIVFAPPTASFLVLLKEANYYVNYEPREVYNPCAYDIFSVLINYQAWPFPFSNTQSNVFMIFYFALIGLLGVESFLRFVQRFADRWKSQGTNGVLSYFTVVQHMCTIAVFAAWVINAGYNISYGVSCIVWWVISAIVAPQAMLAFATSAITLIASVGGTMLHLRSTMTNLENELKLKAAQEMQNLLQQARNAAGLADVGKGDFGQNSIDPTTLVEAAEGNTNAIEKIAVSFGIESCLVEFCIAVAKKNPQALQDALCGKKNAFCR